jgi:hypothetical protein
MFSNPEEGWTEQAAAYSPTAGFFTFTSNAPGADVEVRARYRMVSGVFGAWLYDDIITATITVPYVDLTGTPSKLEDINPREGTKLGGIATGADVTGNNTSKDTSAVAGVPAATIAGAVATLTNSGFLDTEAPPVPTGLTMTSTLTDSGAKLSLSWAASPAADFAYFVLAIKEGSGNYVEEVITSPTFERSAVSRNKTFTAKVKAVDRAPNASGFSPEVTHTTIRDNVAPALPTTLGVTTAYDQANLSWTNPTDTDLAYIEIWQNTVNNSATATKIDTTNAVAGTPGRYPATNLASATTYYYFLKAVDTSDNASAFTSAISATTAGGIDISVFPPGFVPMKTVSGLPSPVGYSGPTLVYNSVDRLIYSYINGAWTSPVTAAASELGPNTITSAMLVDKSILTAKLDDGAITSEKIKAGAITAEKLTIGSRGQNLVSNPNGVDGTTAGWVVDEGTNGTLGVADFYVAGKKSLLLTKPSTAAILSAANRAFPVVPGKTYVMRMKVSATSSATPTGLYLRLQFGTTLSSDGYVRAGIRAGTYDFVGNGASDGAVHAYEMPWKCPPGVSYASLCVYSWVGGPTSILFSDMEVFEQTTSAVIEDGAVLANKIGAGAVTADKIAANSVSANQLTIQTRPVSVAGLNIRVDPDNVVRWDSGYITYPESDLTYSTKPITAGGMGWNTGWLYPINLAYDTSANSGQLMALYDVSLPSYPNHIPVAVWNGTKELSAKAGVSTVMNGDRIVTGSLQANKIVAKSIGADQLAASSITANEIQVGTITAALIAAGAINTSKLLITSMSEANPDPGFRDVDFWDNVGVYNGKLGTSAGSVPGWYNSHGPDIDNIMGTRMYAMLWEAYFSGTGRQHLWSKTRTNIKGGMTYQLSASGRNASSQNIIVYQRLLDLNGGSLGDIGLTWTPGENTYKSVQFVAPANVYSYQYIVFNFAGIAWAGNAQISNLQTIEASGATAIVDGAITTNKITVGSLNGDRISVGTLDANTIRSGSVISNFVTVANTTGNLGDAVVAVQNPAAKINANTTQIDPGKITISGGTTLANWRGGGDNTQINGGAIAANTIAANKLTIGNRGISFMGVDFSYNRSDGALYWSAGYVFYTDDNNNAQSIPINSGGAAWNGQYTYIYWSQGSNNLTPTTQWNTVQFNNGAYITVCTWFGGANFTPNYGGTIVDGDRITTNTINANRIVTGSITAAQIGAGAITADKLTIGSPTGARLTLANNLMSGYFANGNIAFQIGVF